MNFAILPNLIALAVLVAVFWAIAGRTPSPRLYFWLAGWILVLLHFAVDFVTPPAGLVASILAVASVDALLLAGVAFLTSISGSDERRPRWRLAAAIAVPAVAYVSSAQFGIRNAGFYFVIIAAGATFAAICCWREFSTNKPSLIAVLSGIAGVTALAGWAIARGTPDLGTVGVLAALYCGAGLLYAKAYWRPSVAVMTTVVGFALWGSVFPLGFLLPMFAPGFSVSTEAWNIPKYLVAVGMILTLFEDQIEASKYQAHHDELTGLPNRRLLEDRLDRALAYAQRTRTKLAVLQLDLNRFKEVNDTLGHHAGDMALREIAARLAACIQPGDTLARSGGDEFTVISHFADRSLADALVAGLEKTLSAPVVIDGREVQTGLSIGMAVYPDDGADCDQLHAAADRAMYAVKRAGRDPEDSESGNPRFVAMNS